MIIDRQSFARLGTAALQGLTALAELRDAAQAMKGKLAESPQPVHENPGLAALHRALEVAEFDFRNAAEMIELLTYTVGACAKLWDLLERIPGDSAD